MHNEIWQLTPTPKPATPSNWEQLTQFDQPRAFFGAAVAEDKLYVVGGYDGKNELSATSAYSLTANSWQALPSLSVPRGGLSVVYDGLSLYALGGGWTTPLDTHERFDPAIGVWSNFPSPFPGEWRHLAAASVDDSIYLLGGWSGDYLDIHLRYQSTFKALLPLIRNDE